MNVKEPGKKFLVWQVKHISKQNLVLILSVLIGFTAGLAAVLLKTVVHYMQEFLTYGFHMRYQNYLYVLYPLIGIMLTVLFVKLLNQNKLGHGITNILYSINRKSALMEKDKTYSHMATSALTVGFGGSLGLEAPIVTTGSAIGSNLARLFHLDYKRRTLLIGCGGAAATSAIFEAPITGVVFVLEVLLLELSIPSFIPILLASITGTITAKVILGGEILFSSAATDPFILRQIPLYILLGILAGMVSIYFTRITIGVEEWFLRFKSRYTKGLIGGLLLGLVIFILPPLYGEGYASIKALLSNNSDLLLRNSIFYNFSYNEWVILAFLAFVVLMKAFASAFTSGGGGNGGIFAPSIFVGALTGFFFARLLNIINFTAPVSENNFTLVGMAGLMSGIMHAPLTGIFLVAEITSSYELIVPLMIVSVISYATATYMQPHSIYTMQLARKGHLIYHDKDKTVLTMMDMERVIEKDLKTVNVDANLRELVNVVTKSKRNIFPVLDNNNKLKGIITLDDIRHVMFKPEKHDEIMVAELMHPPPDFIQHNEDMAIVMEKFERTNAWNLPVVIDGKYKGMLSKSKIFSIYRKMLISHSREE